MHSELVFKNSLILKHTAYNSIKTSFNLYSRINRNYLCTYNNSNHIYKANVLFNKDQLINKNDNNTVISNNLCLSCFPYIKIQKYNYSNSNENIIGSDGQPVQPVNEHSQDKCIFCHLDKSRIIYEDDKIIAFHDIKPAAKVHILIIPREHIVNVKDLTYKNHKELLETMKEKGIKILKEQGYTKPCLKNENHKISEQNYDGSMSEGDKEEPIPNTLLISNKEYDSILGFHIPPFTSVGHLHLHLLGLPFKNWVKSCKYKSIRFPHYFESIDNIIEELKKKEQAKTSTADTKNGKTVTSKSSKDKKEHTNNINANQVSATNTTSSSSSKVGNKTKPPTPKQSEMKV